MSQRAENRLTAVFHTLVKLDWITENELRQVVESVDRGQRDDPQVPVAGYILKADEREIKRIRELSDRVMAGMYTPEGELPWAKRDDD